MVSPRQKLCDSKVWYPRAYGDTGLTKEEGELQCMVPTGVRRYRCLSGQQQAQRYGTHGRTEIPSARKGERMTQPWYPRAYGDTGCHRVTTPSKSMVPTGVRRYRSVHASFKNVVLSIWFTIVINACLAVLSIYGLTILFNEEVFPLWGQILTIALFTGSMWCNVVCAYYTYLIGKGILKDPLTTL